MAAKEIPVVTTESIPGRRFEALGPIVVLVGGVHHPKTGVDQVRAEAAKIGADAVVGFHVSAAVGKYVAYGTAVRFVE